LTPPGPTPKLFDEYDFKEAELFKEVELVPGGTP
jgi:hypothetical protein